MGNLDRPDLEKEQVLNLLRVSVICSVFNRASTIKRALSSIKSQTYKDVECVVVDGGSTDGTADIIQSVLSPSDKFISEPDKGVYDALNKGLSLVSGNIVAILHSDDLYASDEILEMVVAVFTKSKIDLVYGDAAFFDRKDPKKIVRYYKSSPFSKRHLAWGQMPAHPAMFFRKKIYQESEGFKIDYKIAADYEFLCRLVANQKVASKYVSKPMVLMQLGGLSTAGFKSTIILNKEVRRALIENGIYTNYAMILSKYPKKILGFISS